MLVGGLRCANPPYRLRHIFTVILRSRACAASRRMAAGTGACGHPSRLAQEGEDLRMTAALEGRGGSRNTFAAPRRSTSARHGGNTAFSKRGFNGRVTILADIARDLF